MKEKLSNILMIGGNARKSGKTTLTCRLLEHFTQQHSIAAIKVALYDDAHVFREHYPEGGEAGYLEINEKDASLRKDSGKYMASGAAQSWFIAATTDWEDEVVKRVRQIVGRDKTVVIESNALRKSFIPGLFIMVNFPGKETKESARAVSEYADLTMDTGDELFENITRYIEIEDYSWKLKKNQS